MSLHRGFDMRTEIRDFLRSPASKGLTGIDVAVLRALVHYADPDGYCWPSRTDLVEQTRYSRRAVVYALRALEQAGALAVTERPGTTPIFTVFPQVRTGGGAPHAGGGAPGAGVHHVQGGGAPRAPGSSKELPPPISPPTGGGETIELLPGTTVQPKAPITIKINGHRSPSADLEPDFETWYQAFPRHVGKGAARKSYAAARRKVNPDVLLDAALRYAVERSGEDQRYTKHPATWLNQECWTDEPARNPATERPPSERWMV